MSPERLAGEAYGRSSDMWALGLILYEMLTGKPGFVGETFPTICAAILGGAYPKLADTRPDIPAIAPRPATCGGNGSSMICCN